MIATAVPLPPVSVSASSASGLRHASQHKAQEPAWHAGFLRLLPAIQQQARQAFRHVPREAREEAVQEVVCNALVAYHRLAERGKVIIAYASPLVRFAVAQVRSGRRVGGRLNVRDISSAYCRQCKGVVIERLGDCQYDERSRKWQEIVVEDKRTRPAEVAAIRIDFTGWLATLSRRDRQVAEALAIGEPTTSAARIFRVSASRISQLRRKFYEAWQQFHDEPIGGPVLA